VSLWTRNIVVFKSREFAFCAAIYRDKTRDWFHLPRASSKREISLESRGVPAPRAESRLISRRGQKSRKEGFALGAYAATGRQFPEGECDPDGDNAPSHKARFSYYTTRRVPASSIARARAEESRIDGDSRARCFRILATLPEGDPQLRYLKCSRAARCSGAESIAPR
jgi:hypothetical protein